MMTTRFFIASLALGVALMTSCNSEPVDLSKDNKIAALRTLADIDVRILTTGNEVVTLTSVEKVSLSNANGTSYTVTVNGNITYNAVSLDASHANDGMNVLKNPGFYQVPYINKKFVRVLPISGSNAMQLNINPNGISTTATGIIIEEMSGL
jgi:hypothetical protein